MYHYHHAHARAQTLNTPDSLAYNDFGVSVTSHHAFPVPLQKSGWRQFEPDAVLADEEEDEEEEVHIVPVDQYDCELDPVFITLEEERPIQSTNQTHGKCVRQDCQRKRHRWRRHSESPTYLARVCRSLQSCMSSWLPCRKKARLHNQEELRRPASVVKICDRRISPLKEERQAYECRPTSRAILPYYVKETIEPELITVPVRHATVRTSFQQIVGTQNSFSQKVLICNSASPAQKIVTGKPPLPPSAANRRRQLIEQGTLEQLRNSRRSPPCSAVSQNHSSPELSKRKHAPNKVKAVKRQKNCRPTSPVYHPQNEKVLPFVQSRPMVPAPVYPRIRPSEDPHRQNQDDDPQNPKSLEGDTKEDECSKPVPVHEGSGDEFTTGKPTLAEENDLALDLIAQWGNIKSLYIPLKSHVPSRSCPKFPLFQKEFSKRELETKMWKFKVNQKRRQEFICHARELRRAHWHTRRQMGLFKRKIRKDKEIDEADTQPEPQAHPDPEFEPRTLPTRPYTTPLVDNSLSDTTMALYLSEYKKRPQHSEKKCDGENVSIMSSVRDNETDLSCASQIPSNTSQATFYHIKEFYDDEGDAGEEEVSYNPMPVKSAKSNKRDHKHKKRREYPSYCYDRDSEGDDDTYDNRPVACYNSESKTEAIKTWNKKNQEMRKKLKSPTQKKRTPSFPQKYAPEERPTRCRNSRRARRSPSPPLVRQISWSSAPAAPANSLALLNKAPASARPGSVNEESKKSARVPKIFNPKLSPRPRRFAAHSKSEIITSKKPDDIMNDMLLTIHQVSWASAEIYCSQLRQLSKLAPRVLSRHIPPLVEILLQKVAVARSKVSGPAIKVLRWLYDIAPKLMEQVCDVVIGAMLDKLGGPLFIDSECIEILKIVVGHSSLGQSCLAFAKHGAGHRMSVSRCTAAKFLYELISLLDMERAIGSQTAMQKRLTSSLFEAATCFLYDSNMNTKDYGRQMYCYLLDHHNFWRLYFKHVPHELKQRVNPVLDEIRDLL